MQSECLAVSPDLICSYAWKVPAERPAIFDRAQRLMEKSSRGAAKPEHPSVPWKAYLASREFQHLSSDLAEAFFSELPPAIHGDALHPGGLTLEACAPGAAASKPAQGLLAPVLAGGTPEPRAAAA
jgi:hypothetical protein